MMISRRILAVAVATTLQASLLWGGVPATYIGPNGGAYGTAANWSGGVVPSNGGLNTYDVIINGDASAVTVLMNVNVTIDTLTINAGDGLTMNNNQGLTIAGGSISNQGVLGINSAGNLTDLLLSGSTVLAGAGTVSLSNRSENRIYGAGTLTTSNLITGAGQLGVNTISLVNGGTIVAGSSADLRIDPVAFLTNNGTLRASGGTLFLEAATYTGGVVEALGSSVVQVNGGASVQGAALQSTATAAIQFNGGQIVNSTSSGLVRLPNNQSGHLAGTFHNAGTLALQSAGNLSDLILDGSVLLAGGGTVALTNRAENRIYGSGTLTTSNTIVGAGQLGLNLIAVVNDGTMVATSSAGLVIDPVEGPNGFVNNGALRADGGPLTLAAGTYTNNGVIHAANGSNVFLGGGAVIAGGSLTTSGGSAIIMSSSVVENAASDGVLQINNNSSARIKGVLTNSGVVRLESVGNLTDLIALGDVTFAGGGSLTLSNRNENRIYGNGGTERITFENAVRGSGQMGVNLAAFTNKNLIVATGSNGLVIDPIDAADGFINMGTLRADGGPLTLATGTYTNNGVIHAANGSQVILGASATIVGGTLTTSGTVSTMIMASSIVENALNLGVLQINNNSNGVLRGTLTNNGVVRVNSAGNLTDLIISGNTTLAGTGTVTMSNRSENRIYGNAGVRLTNDITIQGAGQLGVDLISITNNNLIMATSSAGIVIDPTSGPNGFVNNGVVRAMGGHVVLAAGEYTNAGTFEALNDSLVIANGGAVVTGGTLTSNTAASAFVLAGAVIDSVRSTGRIRINNNTNGVFRNTVTNDGLIEMLSAGNLTDLMSQGDATLAGAGTLTATNRAENRIYPSLGNRITLNHVIVGAGQIGVNQGGITNGGTITATLPAGIALDPADGLNGFINNGILRAEGGNMVLQAGEYNNAAGQLQALGGSAITIVGNAVVTGGTLTTDSAPTSAIFLNGGRAVSLLTTGAIVIANNNNGFLQGTITNAGSIQLRSAGNLTDLIISGNTTLAGSGTVTMTNRAENRIYGNVSALFTNHNTIVGAGGIGINLIRIDNAGQIIATLPAGIGIDPIDAPDGFTSTGLLRADGAPMTFHASTYTLGGTIEAINGGTLNFAAGEITASVPVMLVSGTVNFNAPVQSVKNIVGTGTVNVGGALTSDAVTHAGPWQITGTHRIRAGTGNAGTSRTAGVPAVNLSTGTLDLTDHALIVDTASGADKLSKIAALNTQLKNAQAGGPWTGRGITSALAVAAPAAFGVGLYDNADLGLAAVGGGTLNSDALFLMIARYGDGTFDGQVDAFDLNLLAANWQRPSGATWSDGDFTYDGAVNAFDLNVLAANWQSGAGGGGSLEAALTLLPVFSGGGVGAVPEPSTLGILLGGGMLLRHRRRRG